MEFGVDDAAAEAASTADFTSWVLITPSESAANYSTSIRDDYIIVPGAATPKFGINSTEEGNHHHCESKVSSPFETLHTLGGVSAEPLSIIQDPDSSACNYNCCANDSPYISTMDPDHEERMSLRPNHEDELEDEVEDAVLSINDHRDSNINCVSAARAVRLYKCYVNWKVLIRQWSSNRMQELSKIYKKRFAGLIYICKSKCCMLLSIGLGAALMGVLMLSAAWRRLRTHNRILKMQLYAKDKKMSQLVFQILQMREFMSHAKRVPVIVAAPDPRIPNFE